MLAATVVIKGERRTVSTNAVIDILGEGVITTSFVSLQ